ncbi:HTH-type transcriptional regulator BetI [Pseudovibrio sp. Ad46]|uniref:TetR/AcrR family transcriptional regulator n=1 Tax=unclassified Pseudovibrio TaxID=2627060 RepID=UPI00070DAC2D|nr:MULTISPECIES: TetR/AcrR family transcriptional regulator [unclassified Pseudovibrio]KZK77312.1 HTH-type transcriptional regulator BetI [Pseudovibrio sp. Ad46]KZL02990.1 HTH-type transcriptional regulator BetI [Pseudovibrio sp. W74]KZL04990.1 HTH-type transcriptional regulator BetI [Pseudovibrio sp. Ad14]
MVSKLDKKKQRGENTRKALIKSTIDCLDRLGYAETSINRVLEGVDVSRGALMHHFPSKEDLVIGTVDFLLSRILRHYQQESPNSFPFAQVTHSGNGTLADALVTYWKNIIDTPEGRAFSEIIMATRTDKALSLRISPKLEDWNEQLNQFFLPPGLDKEAIEDVTLTLLIWRSFIRGMIFQQEFHSDPDYIEKIIRKFAMIMEPHLKLAQTQSGT